MTTKDGRILYWLFGQDGKSHWVATENTSQANKKELLFESVLFNIVIHTERVTQSLHQPLHYLQSKMNK